MDLYHADVRLPVGFIAPTGRVALKWTRHAEQALDNDRYGNIPKFNTATLDNLKVIEVGVENNRVMKILFRGSIDADRDLCMVLIPGKTWIVKTVWVNLRTDAHRTLDRSRYAC